MLGVILGTVLGGIVLLIIIILTILYFWRWRVKAEETKLRLTARLTGIDESEVNIIKFIMFLISSPAIKLTSKLYSSYLW